MYSEVSEEFINTIRSPSRTFNARLKINGKWYSTGLKKMTYENSSSSEESLQLGSAVSAKIELTVAKIDELFENTEISVEIGLKLQGGAYEYVPVGIFTAEHPTNDENSTTFTAYDRMIKTTGIYISDLSYPAKAKDVLNEISVQCGVLIDTSGIDVVIEKRPEGYTCREMIGYIASLVGGFACVNRIGTIIIKWYEQTDFKLDLSRIMTFEKTESNYHLDYLTANIDNSNSYTAGGGTLGVTFDNPFMTSSGLEDVYNKIKGFTYREVELKAPADIRLDVWDIITAAVNGVEYSVPIMNIVYEYDGGMSMTVKSFGKTEVETSTDFKGPTSKAVERMYSELITTKELVAKKVDAEWVKANTVTSEKVISIEADILSIKNNYLQTNEADIKYATIEKLDGVEGKFEDFYAKDFESAVSHISNLTAEVEKVNTLMFGSASGGSLTTEFSNSIVANIGDAQIKSAMIESIAADKITALDLNTTKFKVHSENGMSYWQDNTIIIKDSNRIRVQIGKDANSDYNMYVWDKSGNLMFDALGLTESGVQREIIRNDMIKEDANINASKLDIESLFNVINEDGSHTLKSSKIYVDANKQTLDIVFKNMTTNVTNLQNTVTTQGTQLTAVQGQISSKVWQQDISTAVNNLQIGGRNLFQGTKKFVFQNVIALDGVGGVIIAEQYKGLTVRLKTTAWNFYRPTINLEAGSYVFSAYAKGNTIYKVQMLVVDTVKQINIQSSLFSITGDWEKYYINFTIKEKTNVRFYFESTGAGDIYECGWKLEEGNKATDWTPAPEDIDVDISSVDTKVTKVSNQYTTLNQSLTSLTATVNSNTTKISEKADGSTVTALQANVTALTADLSGFKTSVTETYTSKTEFNNLQIGGRNLLLNTADLTTWTTESGVTVAKDADGYFKVLTTKNTSWFSIYRVVTNVSAGQTYMLSGYSKKGTKAGYVVIRHYNSGNILLQQSVSEGRFTVKFTVPVGAASKITVYLGLQPTTSGDYTYFKLPKLESGDKATDWTPAPEDVDEKFTEYSTTTQMNSAITQSANSVLTTVSSNYATKASLELKVDKNKLISEINASADIITLKSNRFVLDSTNAKIAADGKVKFTGGTIGGWDITNTALYSDYDKYRSYIQTAKNDDTWIYSTQIKVDNTYYGTWYVGANGMMHAGSVALNGAYNLQSKSKGISFYDTVHLYNNEPNALFYLDANVITKLDDPNYKKWVTELTIDTLDAFTILYSTDSSNPVYSSFVLTIDAIEKNGILQPYIKPEAYFLVDYTGTGSPLKLTNTDMTNYVDCELSLWGTGKVKYNWHVDGTIYGNVSSDSDRNVKKDIKALDIENSAQFIYSLIPSEFRFKNGTSNRLHHGLIAQDVKESMGDNDWGLFIDKKITDEEYQDVCVNEYTGEQTQLLTARYGLRYDELIADLIATVQSLNNRLKALEK
ncbi:MAG TPA: hypothetical protein DD432_03955 [Eubacterium sp.]|nr:hypothetical protein [Eubacterium sp.]